MQPSRLFSLLLRRVMAPAEMGGGGGGAAVVDDDDLDVDGDASSDEGADDGAESSDAGDVDTGDDESLIVSFGEDDEPPEDDDDAAEAAIAALGDETSNAAFARMRKAKTDLKRQAADLKKRETEALQRARDLEEQLKTLRPVEPTIEVGAEPSLDNYVDEYDTLTPEKRAQFKADHDAWKQRKADADAQKATRESAQREQQQQWQNRIAAVDEATIKLGQKDHKEAIQAFDGTFSVVQRGIIIGALDQPETSALMRYALGRNTTAARKLAAISDPVKFAVAVGEMKAIMKVTKGKKVAPPPEKRVQSNKPNAGAAGNQLERLRAEADRTGDRSKVARYLREHPQAA